MYFGTFYEHLGPLSPQAGSLCADLCSLDLAKLEADTISSLYPAFYECHGVLFTCEGENGRWFHPSHDRARVERLEAYVASLALPCLRGKVLYSMSASIMKPGAHIDWHYDMHARSMVCERLHIPVTTNGGVTFYSKWFGQQDCHRYWLMPCSLYRFNNRTPHAVANASEHYRTHLVFDYVDAGVLRELRRRRKLDVVQQQLLAPVLPGDPAFGPGRPAGEPYGPVPLFRYSRARVESIGSERLPDSFDARNLWRSGDGELIELLRGAARASA